VYYGRYILASEGRLLPPYLFYLEYENSKFLQRCYLSANQWLILYLTYDLVE